MAIKGHTKARILNKNIGFNNYATFKRCRILDNGQAFRFVFACNEVYDVPLEYILTWFSGPTYIIKPGKAKGNKKQNIEEGFKKKNRMIHYRRTLSNGAIRIYFSNGNVYVVAWDTVLMASEIEYEWFGGWTEESIEITREWFKNNRKDISFHLVCKILDERLRYLKEV